LFEENTMFRRWIVVTLAAVIVGFGGWAFASHSQADNTPADANVREQLLDADRAFAKAASEKGLEGWMSVFADDAVRISPLGDKAAVGPAAIRKLDAGLFADAKRKLIWEPIDAGVFADGKNGFTTGRAQLVAHDEADKDKGPWTMRYVTWWRKDSDGRWKVILDTGASVPAKP
jgi:ketosteroid isomerase-like protein